MGLGASLKTKSNCGSRPNLRVATAYHDVGMAIQPLRVKIYEKDGNII
jgi:hypothetical protein